MSHIPASAMPHAKPHDEPAAPPHDAKPPKKPDASAAGSSVPYVTIAAVGALAIGGIVAALALRGSEPKGKRGKRKAKGRGRKQADA